MDILDTVSDFHHCTVSDFFVEDVDDVNSYTLFVSLFVHIVSSGVVM